MKLNSPNRRFAVVRRHADDGSEVVFENEIGCDSDHARDLAEGTNKSCGPNWRDVWPIIRIIPVDVILSPVA